ncbi:MAG: hypothetical protein HYZ53_03475 [Planctomycetes bacterium]|nr:hypothetical protein [Planctomycetota bacterium]
MRGGFLLSLLAGSVALVGLVVSLRIAARPASAVTPPPPTLLFTNDTMGFLQVACGCRGYGGVVERARLIHQLRNQGRPPLLVDAGNSLLGSPESLATQGRHILAVLNILGYAVCNISERDFRLGREVLRARMEEAAFPFVSANIVDAETGELFARPYAVRESRNVRFGFLGVTRQPRFLELRPEAQAELKGVRITDPREAIARYLPEVRGVSEVAVLLSYLPHDENIELASRFPGLDLILEGGNTPQEGVFQFEKGVAFASSADRGVHMGEIQFDMPRPGVVVPRAFFHDTRETGTAGPDERKHLTKAHNCDVCHFKDGRWSLEPLVSMQQMKSGQAGNCGKCH